jgi:hypothetical protein
LSPELNHLREVGFLNARRILYTTPGLHETTRELEGQLLKEIARAKEMANKVIVVYGGKFCYVNADEPTRTMKKMIEEQGPTVRRIQASHCVDMLASEGDHARIAQEVAGAEKVWWMTPG